jgi:hypothetical protein
MGAVLAGNIVVFRQDEGPGAPVTHVFVQPAADGGLSKGTLKTFWKFLQALRAHPISLDIGLE